jgi:hypothetical protein
MPTAKVKATYSLDVETVRELEAMARRMGISKSAALRRAIRLAASAEPGPGEDQLAALDELQRQLGDSPEALEQWQRDARELRRASSRL